MVNKPKNCFKSFYDLLDKFKVDKEYMSISSFNEYVSNTNLGCPGSYRDQTCPSCGLNVIVI